MPRRNQYLLLLALAAAVVCYQRAGGAHGRHYGPMADAFVTALGNIEDRYLYDADERKLFEGAMQGMMSELNDRNSVYQGLDETRRFHEELRQQFGGIGINVSWDRESKSLTVLNPIVGTPAFEQGLLEGDRITKIDGQSTEGFTMQDAVNRLRGKPGDPVRISVARQGEPDELDLTIVRALINVDAVLGDVRRADGTWDFTWQAAPEFGYVRITQFGEKTTKEFERALEQLREKNIQGLVLDVRDNPGGLLEAARDVCDQFITSGVIVTTKDRNKQIIQQYDATGNAKYVEWPLAVLVNGDSASASEIVAACLQDHGRAAVVGERSYGKGTVQTPIELEGGKSMIRLTIAGFWRPSDKNIDRKESAKDDDVWGVLPTPGYEVKLDDEDRLEWAKQRRHRDAQRAGKNGSDESKSFTDPVVEKALEYLRSKTTAKAA